MFAETKAERERKRYIRGVRHLVTCIFQISDKEKEQQNRIWGEWLTAKPRESRDLRDLLAADVRDVFKARALTILLAPSFRLAPFTWVDNTSDANYLSYCNPVPLQALSLPLRDLAFAQLEQSIDHVRTDGHKKSTVNADDSYNTLILHALALLPESDPRAATLFTRYLLNDVSPFFSPDEASGYNPFYSLLLAEVPEQWKRLADAAMQRVIAAEESGSCTPRSYWEKARERYVEHIQTCLFHERFPYSSDLLASQVEFVLGLPDVEGGRFNNWYAEAILRKLPGDAYRDLRYRFALRMLIAPDGHLYAGGISLNALRMMLTDVSGRDIGLTVRLNELIRDSESRAQEREAETAARKARIDAVLALMR